MLSTCSSTESSAPKLSTSLGFDPTIAAKMPTKSSDFISGQSIYDFFDRFVAHGVLGLTNPDELRLISNKHGTWALAFMLGSYGDQLFPVCYGPVICDEARDFDVDPAAWTTAMTIDDFIENQYSLRHDMPKSTEVPALKAEKKKK